MDTVLRTLKINYETIKAASCLLQEAAFIRFTLFFLKSLIQKGPHTFLVCGAL